MYKAFKLSFKNGKELDPLELPSNFILNLRSEVLELPSSLSNPRRFAEISPIRILEFGQVLQVLIPPSHQNVVSEHVQELADFKNDFKGSSETQLSGIIIKFRDHYLKQQDFSPFSILSPFQMGQRFFEYFVTNPPLSEPEKPIFLPHEFCDQFQSMKSIEYLQTEYPSNVFHLIHPLYSFVECLNSDKKLVKDSPTRNLLLVGGYNQSQFDDVDLFCELIKKSEKTTFLIFPELFNQDDKNKLMNAISTIKLVSINDQIKPLFILSSEPLNIALPNFSIQERISSSIPQIKISVPILHHAYELSVEFSKLTNKGIHQFLLTHENCLSSTNSVETKLIPSLVAEKKIDSNLKIISFMFENDSKFPNLSKEPLSNLALHIRLPNTVFFNCTKTIFDLFHRMIFGFPHQEQEKIHVVIVELQDDWHFKTDKTVFPISIDPSNWIHATPSLSPISQVIEITPHSAPDPELEKDSLLHSFISSINDSLKLHDHYNLSFVLNKGYQFFFDSPLTQRFDDFRYSDRAQKHMKHYFHSILPCTLR